MSFQVIQIPVGNMANFTYLVIDEETNQAAVIDPSWNLEKIFDEIKKRDCQVKFVINTHSHFDHVLGNEQMSQITGADIVQNENSELDKQISVTDGDTIEIGKSVLRVLHTPGHSKDSICLVSEGEFVITGDTLFVGNCGRTDLPGSSPSEMYHSLFEKVARLDDALVVYPGHNYGFTPTSTIDKEKKTNYILQPRSKQEFLELMGSSD
jgi:glyoxylase-like metal-dependent hydrolase (beta-lactamase superfamily II)